MGTHQVRYDLFISYSRDDEDEVVRLQSALEKLARPIFRRRAMRVFRDNTGLPVGPAWRRQIHGAIDDSRCMVLVVSPSSARSEPVREELHHWIETREGDDLYLAHLAGTLLWSEADNDWTADSDVPDEIRGLVEEEPGYLKLTEHQSGLDGDARLLNASVLLASPVRKKSVERLLWMEKHKRSRTFATATSLLVCIALVFTFVYALRLRASRLTTNCDPAAQPTSGHLGEVEGSLVSTGVASGQRWGLVIGDALWELDTAAHVEQFGYDPAKAVPKDLASFNALSQTHYAPKDGLLFREIDSGHDQPGRLYLIEAGMPFEVANPNDLSDVGLSVRDAQLVPADPYPMRQPIASLYARPGALVRVHGTDGVWKVDDKGHWIRARRICDDAYVPTLPRSKFIMNNLHFRSDLNAARPDKIDARPIPANVSPSVSITCMPGNYKRRGNGRLHNLTQFKVKYLVNMSTVNSQGKKTGSHEPETVTAPAGGSVPWKVVFRKARKTKGDGSHCRLQIDVLHVYS